MIPLPLIKVKPSVIQMHKHHLARFLTKDLPHCYEHLRKMIIILLDDTEIKKRAIDEVGEEEFNKMRENIDRFRGIYEKVQLLENCVNKANVEDMRKLAEYLVRESRRIATGELPVVDDSILKLWILLIKNTELINFAAPHEELLHADKMHLDFVKGRMQQSLNNRDLE